MDRTIGSAISICAPRNLDEVCRLASWVKVGHNPTVNMLQPQGQTSHLELMVEATDMEQLHQDQGFHRTRREEPSRPQREAQRRDGSQDSACPRYGGRCYSSFSCKAMGKICCWCNKPNHFSNNCCSVRNQSWSHSQSSSCMHTHNCTKSQPL